MREITVSELSKILEEHKKWRDTDEKEGEKADLSHANLSVANLSYADLSCAKLAGANLSGANLSCADLEYAYLSKVDLSGADLSYANLSHASLSSADLSNANLYDADLSGANLYYADLSHANLRVANLSYADLSDADLSGADLSDADLTDTNLSDANLSCADLEYAYLSGANLIRVRGLTIKQLSSVETLCDAELSSERIKQVRKKYPHLHGEVELDEEKLSKRKIITLRSSYKTLSVSEVQSMPNVSIRVKDDCGFYGHSTINHDYNLKAVSGDVVVVDNATGLMWHQSGSDDDMDWNKAKEWVEDLNSEEGYAGYNDWRLPTVDEAVSLLESSEKNKHLYIGPVFSTKQYYIWTGDNPEYDEDGSYDDYNTLFPYDACSVHFYNGYVDGGYIMSTNDVRPVRSVE